MSGLDERCRPFRDNVALYLLPLTVTAPRASRVSAWPRDEFSGAPVKVTTELTGGEPRSLPRSMLPKLEKSTLVLPPVIQVSSSAGMFCAWAGRAAMAARSSALNVKLKRVELFMCVSLLSCRSLALARISIGSGPKAQVGVYLSWQSGGFSQVALLAFQLAQNHEEIGDTLVSVAVPGWMKPARRGYCDDNAMRGGSPGKLG